MKNTVIFATSKFIIARAAARNLKAGLFCVSETGVFFTYKAAARLQYRTPDRGKLPRKQCVSTAVFGGPLFCLPVNVGTHHAHRNHNTARVQRAADHPRSLAATRGQNRAGFNPPSPGIFGEIEAAEITIKGLFSVP